MSEQILKNILDESIASFRSYKTLAEKAMAQISDEEFFRAIDSEANSIAVIVKHLGGNLRSRWSDFLTSDGEKADRNRDSEFVAETDTRENLIEAWENGWRILLGSLESLKPEDLSKIVQIRGEDFTVVKAINRSLAHTAYHIGQITLLAKHFRSSEWKTLSIPRNQSAEFNDYLTKKEDKGNYLEAAQEFTKETEKLK
ncbi:MAG TPA: DUF1572 family protein [Pyrinomonadaceae bacterium]|jgi:hypothetical protein